MINIQKQTWHRVTIYLLTTEGGSCQLELYSEPRGIADVEAYICRLWVDEPHRRQGIAKALLDTAEEIARREKMPAVFLEWNENDSPEWVVKYYLQRGYTRVTANIEDDVLMKLQLTKPKK